MPIPQEEIDFIKRTVSILNLIESSGITLKKQGKNYTGLCPFHNDTDPSLIVTPEKGFYHCLGHCGEGGDQYSWVQKRDKVDFHEAHKTLLKFAGGMPGKTSSRSTLSEVAVEEEIKNEGDETKSHPLVAEDYKLLSRVVEFYHEALKADKAALKYLEKRGLKSEEAIKTFKLGVARRSLGDKIQGQTDIKKRLANIGILKPSGHELFSGSLVFPVFNENGLVTEMYGRKISASLRKGTPKHLYLPGPHQGIWNFSCLNANEVILCESLIDALTFWSNGFYNVTTSYGINGFTDELKKALVTKGVKRVVFAYDADEPGDQAAKVHAEILSQKGVACYRLKFPKGMDANSFAVRHQPAEKYLAEQLKKAVLMGDHRLKETLPVTEYPASNPVENKKETKPEQPTLSSLVAEAATRIIGGQVEVEEKEDEVLIRIADRIYRIRQFYKNLSPGTIKINILLMRGEAFFQDSMDICLESPRTNYAKRASVQVEVAVDLLLNDLGRILFKLEELQYLLVQEKLNPKEVIVEMTEQEIVAAKALLTTPNLMGRILEDFKRCGMVGEETNKMVAYLSVSSRKLLSPLPLAVIIQSMSAAGKTALMEAVLAFMPPEEMDKYSAMTGQSLFYMGNKNMKHKILAIVEEEGAERASYPLKLLQSEGELHIASTGKDPKTGELGSKDYYVKGPVMIVLTTTAVEIDEELQNRCLILTVDESREQTKAIHRIQRNSQTLDGLYSRKLYQEIRKIHQNAQRLLKPIQVVNPFCNALTFRDDQTRMRRDNMKYLTMISAITLLHQYQRETKIQDKNGIQLEYIETTLEDIEIANNLASEVLGRTLDELPPQTRKLLNLIYEMAKKACKEGKMEITDYRFRRKDIRDYTQWGNTQIRLHMQRLEEFEYLLTHKGNRGQSYLYECLYNGEGESGNPFMMGLVPIETLKKRYQTPSTTSTARGKT
jgi:DNA primase catalytic core